MAKIGQHLLVIVLVSSMLILAGCAQYKADLSQNFEENGLSQLNVSERFYIQPALLQDYITQMQGENNSVDGQRLMKAILTYYNEGDYARALCARATSEKQCTVDSAGVLSWQTNLSPDGRFYTWNSNTDWLNLRQTDTYQISHLPLIHYEVYQQKPADEIASMEWNDLRVALFQNLQASGVNMSNETLAVLEPNSPFLQAMAQYAPVRVPDQILDFDTNQIRNRPMRSTGLAGGSLPLGITSEMEYRARFPDTITTATMGGQPLVVQGERNIRIIFNATDNPSGGRVIVVTQRAFSPLGAYTWALPVFGIIITIARDFLVGDKRLWKEDEEE